MDPRSSERPDACCATQLIYEDGTMNVVGLESFVEEVKLAKCGISYAVVSIIGPQSSGKSTLLNRLFNTNFKEMDAVQGRSKTTKGIWMAKCVGVEPCTIVMDLEGADGAERGEVDATFEKRSALFALVVSDVLLINIWCHDIGREHAAMRPLLTTIFQVMVRILSPRKTSLMFVIRDKTKTPVESLEGTLRKDIQKIWESVPKTEAYRETSLSDVFNVEVVALSSFEEKEEAFKEQVVQLRQRFFDLIAPGGHAGDRQWFVPASDFSFSAQDFWTDIKENKDLDLPTREVMLATVRCTQIAEEVYSSFITNEEWCGLKVAIQSHSVPNFGKTLSSILGTCLSKYDADTIYYKDSVRSTKRKQLEEKLLHLVQPAYQSMLEHILSETLDNFKDAIHRAVNGGQGFAVAPRDCNATFMEVFDERCADAIVEQANWDITSRLRDTLHRDIDAHLASVRAAKLSELTTLHESKLKEALSGAVTALLEKARDGTWQAIRNLVRPEIESAVSDCSAALTGFQMDEDTEKQMLLRFENYATKVVEEKAKDVSRMLPVLMKDRFITLIINDSDSIPRVWTGKEDLKVITKTARSSSLKFLSVLAAIRLDNDVDNIWDTLALALLDSEEGSVTTSSVHPLDSKTWEQVPPTKTLITPIKCESLWTEFLKNTEFIISHAIAAQKKARTEKKGVVMRVVAAAGGGMAIAIIIVGVLL